MENTFTLVAKTMSGFEDILAEDLVALYKGIGNTLKRNFKGYEAWVISSNQEVLKLIGLKPSKKIEVYNGSLDCRFVKFEIFEGKYKDMKKEKARRNE